MPTLVFYPIMIAILGLGPAPVIVIATTMAMIPIALNTMVALQSVKPVLLKLGASFSCSRGQVYRRILLPAAVPLAVVGLRLGLIYAIIGTIALEFILADRGLGFAIAMAYRDFEVPTMYGLIVFVTVMSFAVSSLLQKAEQHVRKDMA
jgi:NitT/TauT family transport system permease protein